MDDDLTPLAVLWYATFLSGGGSCSEAHSYFVAGDAVLEPAAATSDSGHVSSGK